MIIPKKFISYLQNRPWFLVLIIGLVLISLPLFRPGMFKIHDFTHGARIVEMTRALKDGHFPVRWSKNFGYGYGMPLFQFYGPLPFYVGSIIYLITGELLLSVKSLFLLCNVFTILGGYLLGKKIYNSKWTACFISLAITFAPYRILNLYVRGAINELWGIMAIIWVLWALIKIVRMEKNGLLFLVLSLSGLFLSHNITTLIIVPFIVVCAIFFLLNSVINLKISKKNSTAIVKRIILGLVMAIGISAFYLFPAYFEKDLTQVNHYILSEYFNFRVHFLYPKQLIRPNWGYGGSQWGPDDTISFFLGFGQIFGLILLMVVNIYGLFYKKFKTFGQFLKKKILAILFLFCVILSLFFSLHYSIFLWERLDLLKFVQFPWRYLGISLIFLSLLIGGGYQEIEKEISKINDTNHKKNLKIIYFGLIIFSIGINGIFLRPEKYILDPTEYYYEDENRIRREMSKTLPDYISATMMTTDPVFELLNEESGYSDEELQILVNKTHLKKIRINLSTRKQVIFQIADYPIWRVKVDGQVTYHTRTPEGTIQVDVNTGFHDIQLELQPTNLRKVSDLISITSLLTFVVILLKSRNTDLLLS